MGVSSGPLFTSGANRPPPPNAVPPSCFEVDVDRDRLESTTPDKDVPYTASAAPPPDCKEDEPEATDNDDDDDGDRCACDAEDDAEDADADGTNDSASAVIWSRHVCGSAPVIHCSTMTTPGTLGSNARCCSSHSIWRTAQSAIGRASRCICSIRPTSLSCCSTVTTGSSVDSADGIATSRRCC